MNTKEKLEAMLGQEVTLYCKYGEITITAVLQKLPEYKNCYILACVETKMTVTARFNPEEVEWDDYYKVFYLITR